jgi:hypothetical protein
MEIAYDLAQGGAAKVWLSVRTPPKHPAADDSRRLHRPRAAALPRAFADAFANFGRRMDVGDLSEYGLPIPEEGVFARMNRLGVAPTIVDQEVVEAIKAGSIEVVRGVESVDATGFDLAGPARVEPDVAICATGRGLEPLVGHLGVLGEDGVPRMLGPLAAAPGLRFMGYVTQPSALGYMSKEAKLTAKAIVRELDSAPSNVARKRCLRER